ncbi:MAG: hypothetical protein ACYTG0_22245, partial [Planctomycetota bacterium]
MLSAVVTVAPNILGSAAGLVDLFADKISTDSTEGVVTRIRQGLDLVDSGVVYQAFPGEVNEVELSSDLANLFLLLNESSDVTMIRGSFDPLFPTFPFSPTVIPPFTRDIIDIPAFNIGGNLGLGGSGGPLVVFLEADLEGDFEISGDQVKGVIKQFLDLTEARAIIPNGTALLDLIPDLGNFVGALDAILDFDLRDVVPPVTIEPLIDIDLPFGLPDIEIPPEMTVDIVDYVEGFGLPTSLRDVVGVFPGVKEFVDIIDGFRNFFTQEFFSDSVYISTLDGPDSINFEHLTGIPVQVYAGGDSDVIRAGGGMGVIDSYDDVFDFASGFTSALFERDPAKIELFGEGGQDTFEVMQRFNSRDFNIDGGSGNDRLLVMGTPFDDIIEIVSATDGDLEEINYFAPDPNGGVEANEVQVVTLPAGTTGGSFTLTFEDPDGNTDTTGPILHNVAGDVVETALAGLTSIGAGNVNVQGEIGGPWVVTFIGDLSHQNQNKLGADGSDLIRVGHDVSIVRRESGSADQGVNEIQKITLPPNGISSDPDEPRYITGGTFRLTFDGERTVELSAFAQGDDVEQALEALPKLDPDDVKVTGSSGGPWFVEFTGDRARATQPLIEALPADSELNGGVEATVTDDPAEDPNAQQSRAKKITITRPKPLSGQLLGGTFTLTFSQLGSSDTTVALAHDASGAAIESALADLDTIDPDEVVVSGQAGGPWTVELTGLPASGGSLTAQAAGLTGGVALNVSETDGSGVNEIQRISTGGATYGTFRLTFDNGTIARTTADLPYDATAGEIFTALESLTSVGSGNVEVTGPAAGPWDVEFVANLAAADQLPIQLDDSNLEGAVSTGSTTTIVQEGDSTTNEEQLVTIVDQHTATGGTFFLHIDTPETGNLVTAPIPHDASAAEVEAAL